MSNDVGIAPYNSTVDGAGRRHCGPCRSGVTPAISLQINACRIAGKRKKDMYKIVINHEITVPPIDLLGKIKYNT